MNEIRVAARSLRRTPRFSVVAVASVALGVAVTAATLAIVNAYLLRSLPYPNADRLYHVVYARPGQPEPRGLTALDWSAAADVVEAADGSAGTRFYLADGAYAQEAAGLSVARGALEVLGLRVATGRPLLADDFEANAESVALIGDALWRDRFGAVPDVVGRTMRAALDDQAEEPRSFRIVGVLSPEYRYAANMSRAVDVVIPLRTPARVYLVRLREGVPASLAESRITEAALNVASSVPPDWSVHLESVRERYVAGLRPLLFAVTGSAGLMLVIVCLNVAVLMLLRGARRTRDVAVRAALGASRKDVLRMIAVDSALVCAPAVLLGLAMAAAALRLLEPSIVQHLGRPAPGGAGAFALDARVLMAIAAVGALAAGLLFAVRALSPWTRGVAEILRGGARSVTDGIAMARIRSWLIAFEIAGSLAMLVACGLMIRSAINLVGTDLGFRIDGIVRARLALPTRAYPDAATLAAFHEQFQERLAVQTGSLVAMTNWPPFYEPPLQGVEIDGAAGVGAEAAVTAVSADYFSVLDIPIREGRAFTRADRIGAEPVALISETLARELWPGGAAVGRQIRTAEMPAARSPLGAWRTVVGVVKDARQNQTDTNTDRIYLPFLQAPNQYAPLFIRSDRPASSWLPVLRAAASELDPSALVTGVSSLADEGDRLLAPARFLTLALTGFAVFASLVAALGIYGVTAYAVQQRERESAIRMAVGATELAVVRMFLKEGGVTLALGIALGLAGAAALTRLLATQLYEVGSFDPATLACACVVLAGAGSLATWLAARGAAKKNPLDALTRD